MIITIPENDSRHDAYIDLIYQGLDEYNAVYGIDPLNYEKILFVKIDDKGNFLGGAKCTIFAEWLSLNLIFAAEKIKALALSYCVMWKNMRTIKNAKA